MFTTVIWATDGSEGADKALTTARDLLGAEGRLIALHIDQRLTGRAAPWPALPDEDDVRQALRDQVAALKDTGVTVDLVIRRTHGEPADAIAALAEETGADAVVCGTHGASALKGAVLGSVAHGLLHAAACPVVVVPDLAGVPSEPPSTATRA
jgi:nucleotide-binding universal stress UspA family protein